MGDSEKNSKIIKTKSEKDDQVIDRIVGYLKPVMLDAIDAKISVVQKSFDTQLKEIKELIQKNQSSPQVAKGGFSQLNPLANIGQQLEEALKGTGLQGLINPQANGVQGVNDGNQPINPLATNLQQNLGGLPVLMQLLNSPVVMNLLGINQNQGAAGLAQMFMEMNMRQAIIGQFKSNAKDEALFSYLVKSGSLDQNTANQIKEVTDTAFFPLQAKMQSWKNDNALIAQQMGIIPQPTINQPQNQVRT